MNDRANANDCLPFGFPFPNQPQPNVYDMNVLPHMYHNFTQFQDYSWHNTTTPFATPVPTAVGEQHPFYQLHTPDPSESDILGSAVLTRSRAAALAQQQPPAHTSYPTSSSQFATENQAVPYATIEISAAPPPPPTPSSAFNTSHDNTRVQHSRQGSLTNPLSFPTSPLTGSGNDSINTIPTAGGSLMTTPQAQAQTLTIRPASPAMTISSISRTSSFQYHLSETNHTLSTLTSSPGQASIILKRPTTRKLRLKNLDKKAICEYALKYPKKRQEDIAALFDIERSTVSKVLKRKDQWLSLDDETGNTRTRVTKFPAVDKTVALWAKEQIDQGVVVSDVSLRKQAKMVARAQGIPESKFKASSGWLENFKSRHRIRKGRYTTPSILASPDEAVDYMNDAAESEECGEDDMDSQAGAPTAIPEEDDDATLIHSTAASYPRGTVAMDQVLLTACSKPLPIDSAVAIEELGSQKSRTAHDVTPERSKLLSSSTSTEATAVDTIATDKQFLFAAETPNTHSNSLASPIQLRNSNNRQLGPLEVHQSLLVMRSFLTETISDSLTTEQKAVWASIEREVVKWSVMQMGGEVSFGSTGTNH